MKFRGASPQISKLSPLGLRPLLIVDNFDCTFFSTLQLMSCRGCVLYGLPLYIFQACKMYSRTIQNVVTAAESRVSAAEKCTVKIVDDKKWP